MTSADLTNLNILELMEKWELMEKVWLISSTPEFWGRGSGFQSGISHNDSGWDAAGSLSKTVQMSGKRGPSEAKKYSHTI